MNSIEEETEDIDVESAADTCNVIISTNKTRTIIGKATPYREDTVVETQDVICSTNLRQENGREVSYKLHPLVTLCEKDSSWHIHTELCCFHCCHQFENRAVRIPQSYTNGIYKVRPMMFCSLSCAKAHILEHNPFDSSMQLLLLHRVARDVHGWNGRVINAAPSRLCLSVFGGPMSIDEFRAASTGCKGMPPVVINVKDPPFVPVRIMTVHTPLESRDSTNKEDDTHESVRGDDGSSSWDVKGLRRPVRPQVLPRADSVSEGASMLEKFTAAKSTGEAWDGKTHDKSASVQSHTPTIQEVQRARNKSTVDKQPDVVKLRDAPVTRTQRTRSSQRDKEKETFQHKPMDEIDLSRFMDTA